MSAILWGTTTMRLLTAAVDGVLRGYRVAVWLAGRD
jgi:hypothetical protein